MVSALFIMQHEYLTEVFNYILCCSIFYVVLSVMIILWYDGYSEKLKKKGDFYEIKA